MLLGNLLHQLILLCLGIIQQKLEFLLLHRKAAKKLVGFRPLDLQLRLAFLKLDLGQTQLGQLLLHLISCYGNLLGNLLNFVDPLLIRSRNLIDHFQPVQKIRKAVCLKQDLPIGNGSGFFHGADALFVFFVQVIQPELGIVQIILTVGNQLSVSSDLLVDHLDLLMQQADLLIYCILTVNQILNLVGRSVVLLTDSVNFRFDFRIFIL